jgi:hypothetical protein
LSDAEYNKFTTALTGSMSVDGILTEQMEQVTAFVRTCIASSNKNEVDVDETLLPKSLHYPATILLAARVTERLGGKVVDVSGQREKSYENAMKHLDNVTLGKIAIEKPINPLVPFVEKDTVSIGADNTPLVY